MSLTAMVYVLAIILLVAACCVAWRLTRPRPAFGSEEEQERLRDANERGYY